MRNYPAANNNKNQADPIKMAKKYLEPAWAKKFWILLITMAVAAFWFVFYSMFMERLPEYTTSAIIKFEDPQYNRSSAVIDFAQEQVYSKIAILQTKSFLESVVDSLHLNIVLGSPEIDRFALFRKIDIGEGAQYGGYELKNAGNRIEVYYTNGKDEVKNQKLITFSLEKGDSTNIEFNGLHFELGNAVLRQFKDIRFWHVSKRGALGGLRK
ncbi:MAG: Wzz/FepE/Etk N-terminal domain-containing protein, partial [Calditrichia bacterium]